MNELCKDCGNTFDHTQHQRCYCCGGRIPIPLTVGAFANSALCYKCFEAKYRIDEYGNLVYIVRLKE